MAACAAAGMAAALLGAQAPSPSPASAAAKDVEPEDVVATIGGVKVTAGMLQKLRSNLPPQFQQAVSRMNKKAFLKSYAELSTLARLAEKEEIPEREPYKDQLAFLRMNFLAQSYLAALNARIEVSPAELQKYYNDNKSNHEEALVRTIYVAFSPNADKQTNADPKAKKLLTEAEAKAKAENLAAQLRQGADFAKLAQENSDDATSAQKGGDLGGIKKNSPGIPAEVKQFIFALQPGEISAPLRQPAGYYVFKLDSVRTTPFEEVRASLTSTVQSLKVKAEIDRILATVEITYDNEAYFTEAPAAPATPPAAPPAPRP